jgi:hypothetical protein
VFTTTDGHAWWTRPFRASAAPAPRFITARVFGVTRTERVLLRANAASTKMAPAKPIRSMRSMAPILPARVSREKLDLLTLAYSLTACTSPLTGC